MKIAILKNYHLEPYFKFFIFFMALVCFSYWDFALNLQTIFYLNFSALKNIKTVLLCLHETLLNISEVFAKGNEAHNNFRLGIGKLLELNISQEVFLKNFNSGEQNYQFIFWGIILSNATGGDKLLRKGLWTHKWLENLCIMIKGDVFSF